MYVYIIYISYIGIKQRIINKIKRNTIYCEKLDVIILNYYNSPANKNIT